MSGDKKRAREHDRNRYQNRKAKGLCAFHGCSKQMEHGIYCLDHKEYYRRAQKRYLNKLSKKLANNIRSLTSDTPTNPLHSSATSRTF